MSEKKKTYPRHLYLGQVIFLLIYAYRGRGIFPFRKFKYLLQFSFKNFKKKYNLYLFSSFLCYNAFVSQFSFAGTITSIILSIIAIWMSISGEQSTNEIRNKISDSTDSLLKTSKKIKRLNNNYEKTMSTQLEELKTVQEQLTKIISTVDNVSQEVSQMQKSTFNTSASENTNTLTNDQKIAIFKNIYQWSIQNDDRLEYLFFTNGILYTF